MDDNQINNHYCQLLFEFVCHDIDNFYCVASVPTYSFFVKTDSGMT